VKLRDQICVGFGAKNEDAIGFVGTPHDVRAAWVIDGVTGINEKNLIGRDGQTDAQWIVAEMCAYLERHAAEAASLRQVLDGLVDHVSGRQAALLKGLTAPEDYDYPAACLILSRPTQMGWEIMRLGDSTFIAEEASGKMLIATFPGSSAESKISKAIHARRLQGETDFEKLRLEFRSDFLASRSRRNRAGGYSIIEASEAAKQHAEYHMTGPLKNLLLCTDGFYRAVDHYGHCASQNFIENCEQGFSKVVVAIRADETADPLCEKFPRIKVGDDAAALLLGAP
jgi:hypothetical protein